MNHRFLRWLEFKILTMREEIFDPCEIHIPSVSTFALLLIFGKSMKSIYSLLATAPINSTGPFGQNVRECGFSLTRILPYKGRIYDQLKNAGQ